MLHSNHGLNRSFRWRFVLIFRYTFSLLYHHISELLIHVKRVRWKKHLLHAIVVNGFCTFYNFIFKKIRFWCGFSNFVKCLSTDQWLKVHYLVDRMQCSKINLKMAVAVKPLKPYKVQKMKRLKRLMRQSWASSQKVYNHTIWNVDRQTATIFTIVFVSCLFGSSCTFLF